MPAAHGSRALRAVVFAAVSVLLGAIGHVLMSGMPLPWWAMTGALAGTGVCAWLCAGRERTTPWIVALTVAVQAALHTLFSLAQTTAEASAAPRTASFGLQWAKYLTCGFDRGSLTTREATRIVVEAGLGDHLSKPPPGPASPVRSGAVDQMAGMAMPGGGHDMAGMTAMSGADAPSSVQHGMSMPGMHAGMAMGILPHGMPGMGMLAAHLLAALVCGLWLAHGERAAFRLLRVLAQWLGTPLHLPGPYRGASVESPVRVRRFDHGVAGPRRLLLTNCVITRGPPVSAAVL